MSITRFGPAFPPRLGQKSGILPYTTKLSPHIFQGETFGDQVEFLTQLQHSVEVLLIVQGKNRGVKISYWMPPMHSESND